jgi:protein-disulfide isomerase
VDVDEKGASRRGVQGVPVIFVNGQRFDGLIGQSQPLR